MIKDGQTGDTGDLDSLTYRYSGGGVSAGAGLVTGTVDAQNAGAAVDTQCFTYDYAQHLTQAWTATDSCTATPTTGNASTVGGPLPYWQSWTYDTAGDRATETDHDPHGVTSNDTTTTYNYPAPGSATDQPHTLSSTTATGPQAVQNTATFGYDPDGSTTSIATGANGAGNQTLTYNDQEQLASDVTVSGNTTYVYDAGGALLVRRDPGQTTLFLGNQQLTQNTATGVVSGTRYYGINGSVIAARTGAGDPQILVPDRQGTDQVSLNPDNDALTRRQYLPFGQTRGMTPTGWAGADKGYVGGTPDDVTSLENLGAREYDPTTGRFLTIDPKFEAGDPTQLGGYDYAGNNPTTGSDPDGLCALLDGKNGRPECASSVVSQLKQDPSFRAQDRAEYVKAVAADALHQWVSAHSPDTDNPDVLRSQWSEAYNGGRQYWSAPVGDGGVLTNACFGLRGCQEAYDYLGSHPDDIAGAKVIAATYCLVHFAECRSEAAGQSFANGLEGLALGALGGLDGAVAEDPAVGKGLGCNSFTGDTQVLMADGTTKPISQVKVGDKITNAQPDSPTTQADTVTAVHITLTDRNYDQVTIATPAGPKTITSTAEHLYWDTTTHTWTRADNLNVGDQLDTPGDGHATVTATRHYAAAQITYNLTINDIHTYYVVAGDTPILVHNANEPCTIDFVHASTTDSLNNIVENGLNASDNVASMAANGTRSVSPGAFFTIKVAGDVTPQDAMGTALGWRPGAGGFVVLRLPSSLVEDLESKGLLVHSSVPYQSAFMPGAYPAINAALADGSASWVNGGPILLPGR